jgi:hypothetical protein
VTNWHIRLFVAALALACAAGYAAAEHRLALVVGNNAYPNLAAHQQLRNAVNDAQAVKATLQSLGFEVLEGYDLKRADLVDKLSEFASRIEVGDIALFFYAGHGIALNGANFLLPTDISAPRSTNRDEEARLTDLALPESRVIERLRGAGARVAIVVLDACRDSPLRTASGRSVGVARGLAPAPAVTGVLSLYSAGFGQSALDRLGPDDRDPNSVFTRVFIEKLKTPGLGLREVAVQTRDSVVTLASSVGQDQIPALYEQIVGGDVYLAGPPRPASDPVPGADEMAWQRVAATSDAGQIGAFIAQFPNSALRPKAEALLASLGSPSIPAPSSPRADEIAWNVIASSRDARQVRLFIADFPHSPLRPKAEALLASLEAAAVAIPDPRADEVAWKYIAGSRDPRQVRAFIADFPRSPLRSKAAALLASLDAPANSRSRSYWNHNGSVVYLVSEGPSRKLYYESPRAGMAAQGVTPGTLLFTGTRNGDEYSGTAYVFKSGCGATPYLVSGRVSADQRTIEMRGQAPKKNADCGIIGYKDDVLIFTLDGSRS